MSTQISLNSHKKNEHSEALECEYCDKIFGSKKRLDQHLVSHLKNREIPCTLCDKTFKVKQSLREHMNIHYETFKCIHCDKCSNTQASLDIHMKFAHATERPFSCEKCNDTFKSQFCLNKHLKKTHDPTRPFMCSKCFQTFQFKEKLDHHFARKHESRNCENCPYCGKQCARLKVHIKICSAKPGQRPTKDFDKKETQSCICHFINATQNWLGRKRKLLSISISILFKMVANIRK